MNELDAQVGQGYRYQWQVAILLALNYLIPSSSNQQNDELNELIKTFLGQVEYIQLEGKLVDADRKKIELEDINLVSNDKMILIQVKVKNDRWTIKDESFVKTLSRFYKHHAELNNGHRFIFLTHREFNPDLDNLRNAINNQTLETNNNAKKLLGYVKNYLNPKPKDSTKSVPIIEVKEDLFLEMLYKTSLIQFEREQHIGSNIKTKLSALRITDTETGYSTLYTKFSEGSIRHEKICLADLHEFLPGLFTGELTDYIYGEPRKRMAEYLLAQTDKVSLPPIGRKSQHVIKKIEQILNREAKILNEREAFILLVATCLPYLFRHYDVTTIEQLIDKLSTEKSIDDIRSLKGEISDVASMINGVDLAKRDINIQGEKIRLPLLGALLHLGSTLAIDDFFITNPPLGIEKASRNERYEWWLQAYVRSVNIENRRLTISFELPTNKREEYESILVDTLYEKVKRIVSNYDDIFTLAKINFTCRVLPEIQSSANLDTIPDNEWVSLKKKVEIKRAESDEAKLQEDVIAKQLRRQWFIQSRLDEAKRMKTEGQLEDAANLLARVVELLAKTGDGHQATYYAQETAKLYEECGLKREAAYQYLRAAELCLYYSANPSLANMDLKKALEHGEYLFDIEVQIRSYLGLAFMEFSNFGNKEVENELQNAYSLIQRLDKKEQKTTWLYEYGLQYAIIALVWEEQSLAERILEQVLQDLPKEAHNERIKLSQLFLQVCTEYHHWQKADQIHIETNEFIGTDLDKGLLMMEYAANLARRGELQKAYGIFKHGMEQLHNHADAYTLAITYQNMQYMLLYNDVDILDFPELNKHDNRRIDLFRKTKNQNRGLSYETNAQEKILFQENKRESLIKLNLALYHYWRKSDWMGIHSVYKTLAILSEQTNDYVNALFYAIRATERKLAEKFGEVLCNREDKKDITTVINRLLTQHYVASEQQVVMKVLGVLADVIPPDLLEKAITLSLTLLQSHENNNRDMFVRQFSAETLRYLARQFNSEQTNWVVKIALKQLDRQQHWQIKDELLKLLKICFLYALPQNFNWQIQLDSLDKALNIAMTETKGHFHSEAQQIVTYIIHIAPPDLRAKAIKHLKEDLNHNSIEILSLRATFEDFPETELKSVLEEILNGINTKPKKIHGGTSISMGSLTPQMVNNFKIPPHFHNWVIDGLIKVAMLNKYNQLNTRRDAIVTLNELLMTTSNLSREMADRITDYLLSGAEDTLPLPSIIKMQLESQKNPFSSIIFNFGNIEQFCQICLETLGLLYAHVSEEQRNRITLALVTGSRHNEPIIRRGVTRAFYAIKEDSQLPNRLLLALIVLLYDSDALVRGEACAVSGKLIIRKLAEPFRDDILDRLLSLAQTESEANVRQGIAIALRDIIKDKPIDEVIKPRIEETLKKLAGDVSYKVRRCATM